MIDKFLHFADEAEALAVLSVNEMSPVVQDVDGNSVTVKIHHGRDHRGAWLTELGVAIVLTATSYDDQGNQLTPPIMVDGYHVNVRLNGFDIDFGAHDSNPATPQRVFV